MRTAGDGVRRAQVLGEQADPQLLDHPADLPDLGRRPRRSGRQRGQQLLVLGPYLGDLVASTPGPGPGWPAASPAAARSPAR